MPALQLDSLLGRSRGDDEPVFLLVRRRERPSFAKRRPASSAVSIVLFVALVLGAVLVAALR